MTLLESPRAFMPLHPQGNALASQSAQRILPTLFAAGAEIYTQGETCNCLYRVEFGAVRIYRLLADGRRHVDTRLGIDHIARDTRCGLTWRGLAGQRARAVFHGGITIHAGADGTEADLSSKNLLLSADAEIDTQPVLVIHADEVKAAHGATVGQPDPTALFYLRSRGLPEPQARALLTGAFCREVIGGIGHAATRALCEAALERALARLGA